MFRITDGKGFQMTFANGCTVSVQWGPQNYCENYRAMFAHPVRSEDWKSKDAEVAAWDAQNRWHDFGSDTVRGRMSVDEVMEFMTMVQRDGVKPRAEG